MIAQDAFFEQLVRETGIADDAARLPEPSVARALADHYHLVGSLTRIDTEKDDTFRLDADGRRLLVKVAPAAEARDVVDLQTAAMLHVEARAPELPVQRIVRGVDDQVDVVVTDAPGRERVLRVLGYVDGTLLHQVAATTRQLGASGATLAQLDDALADFDHPRASRLLLWDLTHFAGLRQLVSYVEEPADQELAHRVFDAFDEHVVPVLPALETQVIHGDYSPFNLVVDVDGPRFVTGVIDFGDVVRAPLLFELSVAAANQVGADPDDPWASAAAIVRGYRTVHALPPDVVALLACTAPARLLLRALVYAWRSAGDPSSRAYARAHSAQDWQRLRRTLAVDPAAVRATLAGTDPSGSSETGEPT